MFSIYKFYIVLYNILYISLYLCKTPRGVCLLFKKKKKKKQNRKKGLKIKN